MKVLRMGCTFVGFLSLVLSLSAQTFTTLYSFNNANGDFPVAPLIQGTDGNFYGTTSWNNFYGQGVGNVFEISPSGNLRGTLNLGGKGGEDPQAGLVQGTDGNFYGTASTGGAYDGGTVFKITPRGLTTLYNFCAQTKCTDGADPAAALVQATDGNFYGTAFSGGAYCCGTVFRITPGGVLTTLYSFCPQGGTCADGMGPQALVQAIDGNFYGTTVYGAQGGGTVFKISSGGLTTLYSFCAQPKCTDGAGPAGPLVQATDGNFYGTTIGGGANDGGTVFKITPGGVLTTLYSFCSPTNCTDGAKPVAALIQATDGNLYGTTIGGGANDGGTVFKITPGGVLTTLYSFCSQIQGGICTDGNYPLAALIQATDGNFYGTTEFGGVDDDCRVPHILRPIPCGTVFSLSVGLGPFVKTLPPAAKVGAGVGILGTDLTGATSVTFNGIPAQFTVQSPTLILTHVPNGATTGAVQVTLPSGMLSSNVPFEVVP